MPNFSTGTVTALLAERPGLQRVEVDGQPAYVLTDLIGPVALGDQVVINTTAVDLGLGSGGWHVVHWNLARDAWRRTGGRSMMKLRYTSLQAEMGSDEDATLESLPGVPVVACDLHSQVACVAEAFAVAAPGRRLVYVMTDGGALPLALSDEVARLRAEGKVAATVTSGHAFGGDHEAVNLASAFVVTPADALVVGPGPGVVGTRSHLGYSGLEVAHVIDTAERLGGRPIACVRWSSADARPEHQGVSHHTTTALSVARATALVAVPKGETVETHHEVVEVEVPHLDLDITTMGRGQHDDPGFFAWAAAAGVLAGVLASASG
ncbi:MAG: DUF3866 family protein [Acidimicrobiales bacterium]